MDKVAGYRALIERYGPGEVADRLLTKWMTDDSSTEKWARIGSRIQAKKDVPLSMRQLVILQFTSWGWSQPQICDAIGSRPDTIRRHFQMMRDKLGMIHVGQAALVAHALREGWIE